MFFSLIIYLTAQNNSPDLIPRIKHQYLLIIVKGFHLYYTSSFLRAVYCIIWPLSNASINGHCFFVYFVMSFEETREWLFRSLTEINIFQNCRYSRKLESTFINITDATTESRENLKRQCATYRTQRIIINSTSSSYLFQIVRF